MPSDHHVRALELASQGSWDEAHEIVQSATDRLSHLIHGYLHRLEGDLSIAQYWYLRGGEDLTTNALRTEWERLVGLAKTTEIAS